MNFTSVIFDADGVLVDSRAQAWEAGRRIATLFDLSVQIDSQKSYRYHFDHIAQTIAVEEHHIATLRSLHRLLMRHYSADIELFNDVLELAASIVVPRFVVTAALADGTRLTLSEHTAIFNAILGNETGSKIEILTELQLSSHPIYITDNIRDVEICHSLAMPVIATGWGYDEINDLAEARPDYLAHNATELSGILASLKLLEPKGV